MNENSTLEEWRPVPGFEGMYAVSNLGRVKSFKNPKMPGLVMKPAISNHRNGYKSVHLELKNGDTSRQFRLNRLVWMTFYGPIPEGLHVDHIDNDQTNNKLENLQLLTSTENNRKRWKDNPNMKSHGGVARRKVRCLETNVVYESLSAAARAVGDSRGNIFHVVRNPKRTCSGYHWAYA